MKIGERGQVTIPIDLRERYGFLPDAEVEFLDEGGRIVLRLVAKPVAASKWQKVRGSLRHKVKDIDTDIEEMRGR